MAEKLKGLALALPVALKAKGKGAEEPADDEDEGGEEEPSAEHLEAAQGLIDAVKAGDAKGVDTALRAHWMLCEESEHEEGPPESGKY